MPNHNADPPASIEIEQALLGAALIDPSVIPAIDGIVAPGDFYSERHGWIYAAMRDLAEANSLDYILLCKELNDRGQLQEIGGDSYLTDLIAGNPSIMAAPSYAQAVADLAVKRRLALGAAQMTMVAHDPGQSADDVLSAAQAILDGANRKTNMNTFTSFGEVIGEVITEAQNPGAGLKTGFHLFDHLTGGLRPGEMILVAARPSHGKTTLALQMAFNVAHKTKIPVAIFSLEMRRQQLIQRLLANIAGVPAGNLRDGHLTDAEWERITYWGALVANAPMWIDDTPDLSASEMRSRLMRMKIKPGLVIVDYIQLMRSADRVENRVQEIAAVSRGVKAIAKTLSIPVMACCQLNRAAEGRADGMPDLSDLRESGQLEQDADIVAFIHRDKMKASINDPI